MVSHPITLLGSGPAPGVRKPLRAAGPLLGLAAAALLLDAVPDLPWPVGPAVAALFAAAGAVRAAQAHAALAGLRSAADRLLLRERRGAPPLSLAWRADELVRAAERDRLADALWRLLAEADPHTLPGASPLHCGAVRAEAALLERLALQLRAPGPVAPRGVLLVRELVDSPASPLYAPGGTAASVRVVASEALAALEVLLP